MFLLSHIFQRGRSVKLSDTYYKYTVEVLELGKNQDFDQFYEKFHGGTFERLFIQKLKEEGVKPNPNDIEMILSLIEYQKGLNSNRKTVNLYTHLHDLIFTQPSQISQAYEELKRIKYVKDKLAAFTIRDIILGEQAPKIAFEQQEYEYAFPVDIWVRKKGWELVTKYSDKTYLHKDPDLKRKLIQLCYDLGLVQQDPAAPLKLNVGLWWAGAKAKKEK